TLRDLNASEWQVRGCRFENSSMSIAKFNRSTIEIVLTDSELESCEFFNCECSLEGTAWIIRGTKFRGGTLQISGIGRLVSSEVNACRNVRISKHLRLLSGSSIEFAQSCIVGQTPTVRKQAAKDQADKDMAEEYWYGSQTRINFKSCTLGGLW